MRACLSTCPFAGRFGDVTALVDAGCAGLCAPGFMCPPGSTSASALPCGSADVYCPLGSGSALGVPVGWYSTPEVASPSERSGVAQCGPGYACSAGVRAPCPSGTYASGFGATGCDVCPAGWCCSAIIETPVWVMLRPAACWHCFVGHSTPTHLSARHPRLLALLCVGGATVTGFACRTGTGVLSFMDHGCSVPVSYCPLGSSSPLPVPLGSYGLMNFLGLYINAAVCEPGR
jgi:hypothetical protein